MVFFKDVFRKRLPPPQLPFDHRKIKDTSKHFKAVMDLITKEDELSSLPIDNQLSLEFGDPSSIHILCFGICDLHMLMQPENDGWSAERVFLSRCAVSKQRLKESGMTFLFKFPSTTYGEDPIFMDGHDPIIWDKDAYVYSE